MKNAKLKVAISIICMIAIAALALCGSMIAAKMGANLDFEKISGGGGAIC